MARPRHPRRLAIELQRDLFTPIAPADHICHLRELAEENNHDWGRVHGYFHEFLLINRRAARVTLLVAADD